MSSVRESWQMQCPHCGSDDELNVQIQTYAALSWHGTDADTSDHEWDGNSSVICGCGWHGTANDCSKAYAEATGES